MNSTHQTFILCYSFHVLINMFLRKRLTDLENGHDYWGVETARDFGKVMYTLLYLKWKTNKDLLCTTWNSAQSYVPDWMEGRFGGEWIHVYVFFLILIGGWFQYCSDFCHTLTWISQCTGYMYIHGWVPSLFTWNYHNIVNQVDFNTKGFLVLKS